jgi:hypothetical protein
MNPYTHLAELCEQEQGAGLSITVPGSSLRQPLFYLEGNLSGFPSGVSKQFLRKHLKFSHKYFLPESLPLIIYPMIRRQIIWVTFSVFKQLNSVAWVRERTIPTERARLVGEVSVNFWG